MKEAKIGDKIRIVKGHGFAGEGWVGTLIDPNLTPYKASKENPNEDKDGHYWCEFLGEEGIPVCVARNHFDVIEEGEEDGSH